MNLEDFPGYDGLYGEVVRCDCYGLQSILFSPDVIFDFGANIGVFSRFAREIFPLARIVAVEPDPSNFAILKEHCPANCSLINQAIGEEAMQVYRAKGAANGAHERYTTDPRLVNENWQQMRIESVRLQNIIKRGINPGERFMVKMDCEGAEYHVMSDPDGMAELLKADYIAVEYHGNHIRDSFSETHVCTLPWKNIMQARRRIPFNHLLQLGDVLREHNALGAGAEIGVASGTLAQELLQWGVQRLYMVDRWKTDPTLVGDADNSQDWHDANLAKCKARVEGYGDCAVFMRGWSHEMADGIRDNSLDFIYLDANHSRAWVQQDLEAWYPKVKPLGFIVGHDYLNPAYGVKQAVDEFCAGKDHKVHVLDEDRIVDAGFWFQKKEI